MARTEVALRGSVNNLRNRVPLGYHALLMRVADGEDSRSHAQ